jgi:hypothetical protein
MGTQEGFWTLGHPTSDEMDDGIGGRISYFQGGEIDWSPGTGPYEMHGMSSSNRP